MDQRSDRTVSRLDRSGMRETTGFADSSGKLMAITTTEPTQTDRDSSRTTSGLVVCPSLFTEAVRNYRREALLARKVASFGIAVQRFQYRGTGNSDDEDISRTTMVADAQASAELLRGENGVSSVAFLGARFGALVAASAAAGADGAPLVLIEPSDDARAYLDQALRAKVISMFRTKTGRSTMAQLLERLNDHGTVDLLGHELPRELYESSEGWRLQEALGSSPRPILLMQFGVEQTLRPENEVLANAWREAGHDVDVSFVGSKLTWWFLHEQMEEGKKIRQKELEEADQVAGTVGNWVASALTKQTQAAQSQVGS